MGLYDRGYWREDEGRVGGWSITAWLVAINVGVFVLGMILSGVKVPIPIIFNGQVVSGLADPLYAYGHFSTYQGIERLQIWRLFTFQFLHSGAMHLLFNMLGLWIFGPLVEQHLGRHRYLAFYLACGVCGALMYMALNLLGYVLVIRMGVPRIPGLLIDATTTPLVGASAGIFGVIIACAHIAPNMRVQLLIPPVPLRLKVLAYTYVGIAAFGLFMNLSNAGGDAAHLGGAVAGFVLIRRPHWLYTFFRLPISRGPKLRITRHEEPGSDEAELDRVLAKISARGLESLTEQEREILRRGTQRRRGR